MLIWPNITVAINVFQKILALTRVRHIEAGRECVDTTVVISNTYM